MKIALLSSGLGHVKRGIETWTEDLARALAARGVDITVYKGAGKKDHVYERVIPCLKRSSALNKRLIKYRPGFLWRIGLATHYTLEETTFTWNLLPELIFKQYDIIHTQDPDVAYILQKVCRAGLLRSKVILAHGTEEDFGFLNQLDYVQHLAPYHLEEARANGVKNKKDFAIGNFIDTEKFRPEIKTDLRRELGIPQEAFVVGCVAAIKKFHKRIDYLIDEMAKVEDANVYLLVAGASGPVTEELIASAKEKLGSRAVFLRDFSRNRIPEVFAAIDLFALCSLKEMMPIALLESISSGVPAVINRYPVEEWMIGPGGESIDMSASGALADAVIKYAENPDLLSEKASAARKHAVDHFSEEAIVNRIISMYNEILGELHGKK